MSVVSAGDALPYAYVQDDFTNLYNRVIYHNSTTTLGRATAIQSASRSMLWRKPDYVAIYDRATTGPEDAQATNETLFKRFNLLLLPKKGTTPAIVENAGGYLTTETTAGGQSLYVETVLPANTAPVLLPIEPMSPAEEMDPTNSAAVLGLRLRVEDPGTTSPTATSYTTRFLHVLEGADAGQPQDPVSRLSSSGGTPFDGVTIATGGTNLVVLFLVDLSQIGAFSSTSYAAPAGQTTTTLSIPAQRDLLCDHRRARTISAAAPGTPMVADAGGVLHFHLLIVASRGR